MEAEIITAILTPIVVFSVAIITKFNHKRFK